LLSRITGYKTYKTREGDTFDALALAMYGEERLAHLIIQYNPNYADVVVFGPNEELRLPIYENADTPETLPPWRRGDSA
jgi:phage tail protein X